MINQVTDGPKWLNEFLNSNGVVKETYRLENKNVDIYSSLLDLASRGTFPVFLPCDDGYTFYAIASNARELIELRLVLRSFLGAIYINHDFFIIKNSECPVEQKLLEAFPEGVIKFSMLDSLKSDLNAQRKLYDNLLAIIHLYEKRPNIALKTSRPIGRILRDFFTACHNTDGISATGLFTEIKYSGAISQRNLLSLEVQALAASQKWLDILNYSQLGHLIAGRVPNKIYSIILQALGYSCLNRVLDGNDYTEESYNNVKQVTGSLSSLFLKPPLYGDNDAYTIDWKRWAICASVHGFSDIEKLLPDSIDSDWLSKLMAWSGLKGSISNVQPNASLNIKSISVNGYNTPTCLDDATELLSLSLTAKSDVLENIFNALDSMPDDLLEELSKLPRPSMLWNLLKEEYFSRQRGWLNWFTDLIQAKNNVDVLGGEVVSNYENWNINTFDQKAIYQLLQNGLSEEKSMILRNALPLLLNWLDQNDIVINNVDFWILYLEIFSLDDSASIHDLSLAGQLASRILSQNLSKDHYARLLEAIEVLWSKSGSVNGFDNLLEIYEILFESVRPSPNLLDNFWNDIIQKFALKNWARLDVSQQYLTKSLAEEILGTGILSVFPSPEIEKDTLPVNTIIDFKGVTLGIYTLTETSALRAKGILESMFKGLNVELNHDHASTERLKNLAHKAKYFIFSTSSAKHQAFYSVSNIRNDLIYPKGKGASSLINAFIEHINI